MKLTILALGIVALLALAAFRPGRDQLKQIPRQVRRMRAERRIERDLERLAAV